MLRAISYVLTFSGGAVFGIAFLCLLQAGKAVSYTHLDVYKRQVRSKYPGRADRKYFI